MPRMLTFKYGIPTIMDVFLLELERVDLDLLQLKRRRNFLCNMIASSLENGLPVEEEQIQQTILETTAQVAPEQHPCEPYEVRFPLTQVALAKAI